MYNQRSAKVRQREPVSVTIETVNGAAYDATVYVALGHRLADLVNDERSFLPVDCDSGEFMMLAKSQIVSIREIETAPEADAPKEESNAEKATVKKFDPYALLKVDPAAPLDEIRAAYKSRIKLVHPDSVASLGLHDDLADAALRATQKLNYAYQKILREREEAESNQGAEFATA